MMLPLTPPQPVIIYPDTDAEADGIALGLVWDQSSEAIVIVVDSTGALVDVSESRVRFTELAWEAQRRSGS
jgi:hypothetical protein